MLPEFPLHVRCDDGEELILETLEDVELGLEWFDSETDDKSVKVYDHRGRPVRLKVEALRVLVCELTEPT